MANPKKEDLDGLVEWVVDTCTNDMMKRSYVPFLGWPIALGMVAEKSWAYGTPTCIDEAIHGKTSVYSDCADFKRKQKLSKADHPELGYLGCIMHVTKQSMHVVNPPSWITHVYKRGEEWIPWDSITPPYLHFLGHHKPSFMNTSWVSVRLSRPLELTDWWIPYILKLCECIMFFYLPSGKLHWKRSVIDVTPANVHITNVSSNWCAPSVYISVGSRVFMKSMISSLGSITPARYCMVSLRRREFFLAR